MNMASETWFDPDCAFLLPEVGIILRTWYCFHWLGLCGSLRRLMIGRHVLGRNSGPWQVESFWGDPGQQQLDWDGR